MREKIVKKNDALPLQFMSEEFALGILEERCSNISEYDKFQFIWEFCNAKKVDHTAALSYMRCAFEQHFNFALMSQEERIEAIQIGLPAKLVYNALLKSRILVPEDLSSFASAFQQLGWCQLASSSHSDFDPQQHLLSMTDNGGVLVVFQLPDLVALAFLFVCPLTAGEGHKMEPGSMQVFFISRRFNLRRQFICPDGFFYDLTPERFQIYRDNNRTKSFFWFRSGVQPSVKQDPLRSLNEMQLCASIDLTAFPGNLISTRSQLTRPHPLITKAAFSQVEVFRLPSGHEPTYVDVEQVNRVEEVPEQHDKEREGEVEERDASALIIEKMEMEELNGLPPSLVLLQELVSSSVPCTLDTSKEVETKLRRILVGYQPGLRESFRAASCLSRLGQPHLAEELLARMVCHSLDDMVISVEDWTPLFYLDTEVVWKALKGLMDKHKARLGEEDRGEEYLTTQLWHNLIELLVQLREFKESLAESKEILRGLTLVEAPESEEDSETLCLQGRGRATWLAEEAVVGVCLSRYYTNTFRSVIALAAVSQITPSPLSLKLRLLDPRPRILDPEWLGEDSLTVVSLRYVNTIVYTRIVEALKVHLPTMGKIAHELARPNSDEIAAACDDMQLRDCENLNSSQLKAVSTALKQKVTVIQGPPGTGKTQVGLFCVFLFQLIDILQILQVAVSIIASAVDLRMKVLAIAETNIAVDNITRRLARIGIAVLRLGRVEKVDGDMVEHTLEGQLKTQAEQESRKVRFTDPRTGRSIPKKTDLTRLLKRTQVVLTTCAGAGDPMLRYHLIDSGQIRLKNYFI